jgi:hypothetical protein
LSSPGDEDAVPNVLAYPIDEATTILERAGVRVRDAVTTAPPRPRAARGEVRVVRQALRCDGSVVLTVAAAGYEKAEAE